MTLIKRTVSRCLLMTLVWAPLFCVSISAQNEKASPAQPQSTSFTEQDASRLMAQMREGLEAHMARKLLAAFDLAAMAEGPTFKGQITAFFNQSESIRVHFKLHEVTGNTAMIDAEMEVLSRNDLAAPLRKHTELRLTAASGAGGWKFVEVQPRNFFSTSAQ